MPIIILFSVIEKKYVLLSKIICEFQPYCAFFLSAEIKLNHLWRVGAGENSKEVEVQKNRSHRDRETIYQRTQDIPPNPKEPWDLEMDYDDTLTPEIPILQLPDVDNTETQVSSKQAVNNLETKVALTQRVNNPASVEPPTTSQTGNASTAEPDLELLAVLLKNPELVFALTSGQAANLSSEETVKLLDMIKAGGAGLTGSSNGLDRQEEDNVRVSLPSPTPSSNPGTVRYSGPNMQLIPDTRRTYCQFFSELYCSVF